VQLTALRTRLARRILALFVLCALAPIGVLGVLSYRRVRAQYTEQAARWLHLLSKEAGLTLIKRLGDLADQLSASAPRLVADGSIPLRAVPVLTAETSAWIRGLALATPGHWRAVLGNASTPPELPAGAARDLQAGQPVLLTSTSSQIWLALQVPGRNPDAPVATLWAEIDPVALLGIDQSTEVLPVGTLLCVLAADRTPLYCPQGVPAPMRDQGRPPGTTSPVYTWRVGTEDLLTTPWVLFLRSRFSAQTWTIAVSVPAVSVQAPMADFQRTFPLVVLLTLLFALALGTTLIRRNTEPLARLQDGIRRLANQDFSQPVHLTSGDEFEDLAHSFNAMARHIQDAGASLRESETRLRTLLESAPAGVITTDASGVIEFVNETAERVFGAQRTDLIGRAVETLVADAPSGALFREPGQARELLARRRDGSTFPIELSVSQAHPGGRTVYTGFVRDVSDRKHAEEERARLETQLRQAQKLETIGTLAGGVAHDFNNILAGVIGYVELALGALPADSQVRGDLLEVKRAGWRGADLARQILVFSRRTEAKQQLVLLDEIVVEALKLLRATLPSTIEIHQHLSPDTAPVLADPTQMHQVLMNLCINASHAMPNGGRLDIGLGMVDLVSGSANVSATLQPGRYVELTVKDTGHGMDRTTLERIFDPFFTTKAPGVGTGLGLSVVHGIVSSNAGDITVASALGSGSTFSVYLPPAREGVEAAAVITPADVTGHEHVLVVDDDAMVAAVTQRVLERYGYRVTVQTSGVEALALLQGDPGQFDLVLTDYTMPQLTGLDLARAARQLRPDLPILLTSGLGEVPSLDERQAHGIREVLMKPVNPRDLGSAIRRALTPVPALPS
jgi:PAS domain S-box-containing protein